MHHQDTSKGLDKVKTPLVTIGIATYNRPDYLYFSLKSIINQKYKNIKIIISDNSEDNRNNLTIINEFIDSRVNYYHHKKNIGSISNFNFLLKKSKNDFFMFASDDDIWHPNFIEECLEKFSASSDSLIAVTTEAIYFSNNRKFPFFREGKNFYQNSNLLNKLDRIKLIIKNCYGNQFYSIFRRDALFDKRGKTWFDKHKINTFNEIGFFVDLSEKGFFVTLPTVRFAKRTVEKTYVQAKWEMNNLVQLPKSSIIELLNTINYHFDSLQLIIKTINTIKIAFFYKIYLIFYTTYLLFKHLLKLLINSFI